MTELPTLPQYHHRRSRTSIIGHVMLQASTMYISHRALSRGRLLGKYKLPDSSDAGFFVFELSLHHASKPSRTSPAPPGGSEQCDKLAIAL